MTRSAASVTALLALALAACLGMPYGAAAGSRSAGCTPAFVGGAMRFCGPASAKLSVFPGVTFRKGTCKREVVAGEPTLTLELGQLVPGSKTNGGRPYLKIGISGPLSRPTSGYVIAFSRGTRWSGLGESLRTTARGGAFVARGTPPSRGKATGSFRC